MIASPPFGSCQRRTRHRLAGATGRRPTSASVEAPCGRRAPAELPPSSSFRLPRGRFRQTHFASVALAAAMAPLTDVAPSCSPAAIRGTNERQDARGSSPLAPSHAVQSRRLQGRRAGPDDGSPVPVCAKSSASSLGPKRAIVHPRQLDLVLPGDLTGISLSGRPLLTSASDTSP